MWQVRFYQLTRVFLKILFQLFASARIIQVRFFIYEIGGYSFDFYVWHVRLGMNEQVFFDFFF